MSSPAQVQSAFSQLPKSIRDDYHDLVAMLQYRRPHYSAAEEKFIARFIDPLRVTEDAYGNLFKVVGKNPTILWSCHVDTVHHAGGSQDLVLKDGKLQLAKHCTANCLGGDDTAGVWMLTRMIRAKVPGFYVFHRGEERGCLGAKWILDQSPWLLEGMTAAIAFDRMGTEDIISHQRGQRCASEEFIASLAAGLGMKHASKHGMYTDTAVYAKKIPECSNISVGYDNAHSHSETLDVYYLFALRKAVLQLDTSKLVIARDPAAKPDYSYNKPADYTFDWKRYKWDKKLRTWVDPIDGTAIMLGSGSETASANTAYPDHGYTPTNYGAYGYLPPAGTYTNVTEHNKKGKELAATFDGIYEEEEEPAKATTEKVDPPTTPVPAIASAASARQDWVKTQARFVTLADFARAYPEEVGDYLEQLGMTPLAMQAHIDQIYEQKVVGPNGASEGGTP